MLDIKFIRENPDIVRQAVANRHDTAPIDEILKLDTQRRQKVGELDGLRQQRKALSKEREKAQEKGRALRAEIGRPAQRSDCLSRPRVPEHRFAQPREKRGGRGPIASVLNREAEHLLALLDLVERDARASQHTQAASDGLAGLGV